MARNSRSNSGSDSSSASESGQTQSSSSEESDPTGTSSNYSNQGNSPSASSDYSGQDESTATPSYDNQSGSTGYANQETYSNSRDPQANHQETDGSNAQNSAQSTGNQDSGNQNSGTQESGNSGGQGGQGAAGPPADSSSQGGGDGEAGFFESAGGVAGQAYGTVLGSGAGSLAGPAGTVGGGMLGGMAGEEVGSAVGEKVDDAVGWAGDTISDAGSWLQDNAGNIADGALKVVNPIGASIFEEVTDGGFSGLQERQQAAEERAANYDKAKETLQSGGSVSTSDELLDPARQGLDLFEKFLPLYQEWNGSGPEFEAKVVKEYDELREIDFGAFRADAELLSSIKDKLHDQNESMDRTFRGAEETWKGEASEAASGKAQTYNHAGASVIQETEALAGAIGPVTDAIEEAVRAYAEFVLDLGAELKCAGKTPEETKDEIRKANGDIKPEDLGDIGIDDIFSGAWSAIKGAAIGAICGGPLGAIVGEFAGAADAVGDIRQGLIDDAKEWLDGAFVPEMQERYGQFQEQSGSVQDVVQSAYDKMLEAAEVQEDPFQGMQDGEGDNGQSPSPTDSTSNAEPATNDAGAGAGAGAGGGGAGGGAGGGGAGGGGAGGGGMPETPETPEAPEPPDAEMPGGPGAEGQQGRPEEVILGEGDDAVTVQEPDEQGTTPVTVIGEDGQPKTYDVSFGPEQAQGEPGVGPGGQSMAGQPGAGMPSAAGGQPVPGEPEATPIQADEDGKAVIKEGDRTITLEEGPDGGVKVDIDNGQGEPPLNQTINFGDDEAAEPPAGGGIGEPAPAPEPPMGGGIGESAPAPEPGTPPQVGGFDAQPAGVPSGMAADATVTGIAGSGPAGDTGAAPADAPAATSPQSAGLTSMSGLGEGAQNSFGSTAGQLLGLDEQEPADDPEQQKSGQRGSSGMASMGDSAAEGEPQGASGMASMGDSGAQAGQGSGQGASQGAAGGGMMGGMGAMGGAQQQGGDQERSNDSPWRTQGQLFDDGLDASNVRFRSVLGEDRGR